VKLLTTTSILLFQMALSAQTPSDAVVAATPIGTYDLGEVTIVGTRRTDTTSTVGIQNMELYNRMNTAS
jgi:hypothetical protein